MKIESFFRPSESDKTSEKLRKQQEKETLLFKGRLGLREYALSIGKSTEELLKGAILEVKDRYLQCFKKEGSNKIPSVPEIVAEVAIDYMRSGLSIPRVFFGGRYKLEDVLQAVSCIDASVFIKEILEKGFGISSTIERCRLGIVKDHHYLQLEDGTIIDPILRTRRNTTGFFKNQAEHKRLIGKFNRGGVDLLVNQLLVILDLKKRRG